MTEQKPKKPILILSLDTETGGFNPSFNALLTVGIAFIKLSDCYDLSKIEKHEWKLSNSFIVVDKVPSKAQVDVIPRYVEKQALEINKLNLYELETTGTYVEDLSKEFCAKLDEWNKEYRVHLLGQNLKFDLAFIRRNMPLLYSKLDNLTTHHELRTLTTAFNIARCKEDGVDVLEYGYQKSTSMDNLRKALGIESSGQTHSASVDAEDNIKAFITILNKFEGRL